MAIQMRQGNEVDFDAEKMIPGEWAVSKDARIVRMCFAPGVVVRMATYEAFEADMEQIRDVLAEAKTTEEAIERIRDEIHDTEIMVENYALSAKSYAVGSTGVRDDEDTDNAKYYYEQSKRIAQGVNGIVPMGTITFEELPTGDVVNNAMYNISNAFTSDERFNDGGGVYYGAGNNVVWTASGKWDVTAASGVTGIKGENEIDYRQGNVNITRDNIGLGDDVFGTADISSIGDGTVKGAIRDIHYTKVLSNVSLLSVNENGLYYVESPTDAPSGGEYSGYLRVTNYPSDNSNYKVIEFTPYNFTGTYVNVCTGGTWNGWKEVAFADEFLPLTGGTLSGALSFDGYGYFAADSNEMDIVTQQDKDFTKRRVLSIKNANSDLEYATIMYDSITNKNYNIFGEHNKPTGSYTGNGSATARTIDIGGIGSFLILATSGGATVIASWQGAIAFNPYTSDINYFTSDIVNFNGGKLNIATDNINVNYNGSVYEYHVI